MAVAVSYEKRVLRVTSRRIPAQLVGCELVGDMLRLRVQSLGGRPLDGAQLYLQREDSLHGIVAALVPGDRPDAWQVELPVSSLDIRARAVSSRVWQISLAPGSGEPVAEQWRESSQPAGAAPLWVAPDARLDQALVGGRLVGAAADALGSARLVEQRPVAIVDRLRHADGQDLLIGGTAPGQTLAALVLVHTDGTELEVPVTGADGRWSATIPVDGTPGSPALRRLRGGRWRIHARDVDAQQGAVPVLVDDARSAALDGFHQFSGHQVAVRSRADQSLGLTVDTGGPWQDRGAYYRRRNKKVTYRLARRQPLEDTILFEAWKGRQYSDNPRAIYEELVRRGDPRRMVWAVQDFSVELPDGVESVVRFGRDYYRHLGRARWIVSNDSLAPHYVKRDGSHLPADLARHAPQADRVRHRGPADVEQELPQGVRPRGPQVGLPGVAQPVQHPDPASRLPLRGRGAGLRLPAQRRVLPPGRARGPGRGGAAAARASSRASG